LHDHQPVPEIFTEGKSAGEPDEQLPAYEPMQKGKPKGAPNTTPATTAPVPRASASSSLLSPGSAYTPPAGAPPPSSRPTTPNSRPITPNSINRTNPYAGALLARANNGGGDSGMPESLGEMDRTVSQLMRDRRANAGVSAIPQEVNRI